jgi:hypothetical protein
VCGAGRVAEIRSARAGLATSRSRWAGDWKARASRSSIRLLATRLLHEPFSRALAKKIAIDSSGCAPRARAEVRSGRIDVLESRFGLRGCSALFVWRANESLQQMGAVGG